MEKQKMKELETLRAGANVGLVAYDKKAGKTGLVDISAISGNTPWFGRRWRKEYATTEGEPVGDIEIGKALPYLLGLGGYLVQNDHSRKKLSASDHRLLENGAPADLSGGAGHYQWGWNVPFYYQIYEDDTYEYESISIAGPRPGFWNYYIPVGSRSCAGYAAMDRTNARLMSVVNGTAQFRGGNNDASLDGAFNSQLELPATNMSIEDFRTAARKNGKLWFASERTMQYVTAFLKRIIFGNRNVQVAFSESLDKNGLRCGGTGGGAGYPPGWDTDYRTYPYVPLGTGVEKGDFMGLLKTTIKGKTGDVEITGIPSFYGLKNDYKYISAVSENILLECNADKSQTLYIDTHINGSLMPLDSVSGLTAVGRTPSITTSGWVYPKHYIMKDLAFCPADTGGSQSTYWGDGYYSAARTSGLYSACLLGYTYRDGDAGSLSFDGSCGIKKANPQQGAFLCEWAEEFTTVPVWVHETE